MNLTQYLLTNYAYSLISQDCCRLCQPIAVGLLLDYITKDRTSDRLGYIYAGLVILSALAYVLFSTFGCYLAELFGMRTRAAYSTVIYGEASLWIALTENIYIDV